MGAQVPTYRILAGVRTDILLVALGHTLKCKIHQVGWDEMAKEFQQAQPLQHFDVEIIIHRT